MAKRKVGQNRFRTAVDEKEKGGASGKKNYSAIDFSKVAKNVEYWKPEVGNHRVNIIPFEIKSKMHPLVARGEAEVGELDIFLDLFVHQRVGEEEKTVVCPNKNYGKKCPICEKGSELWKDGKQDLAKNYFAKRRSFFNIQDLNDENSKPQVFDVSQFLFTSELLEEANACSDGEDIIPFAEIDEGSEVHFRVSEKAFGAGKMKEFKKFDFKKRKEALDESIIDEAYSFDLGIHLHTYAELEAMLYGEPSDDEEDEDEEDVRPTKKSTPFSAEEDDEDDVEDEDEEEEEVKPTPKKKAKATSDDEETCPAGGTFGDDFDDYEECEECPSFRQCRKASR